MSLSQRDENDKKSEIPISTSCFGYQISWRGSWKSFSVVGPSLQISGELSSVGEHGKAAQPGENLAVLWENLKTGRKHFPIKPTPEAISGCRKSCCYQKCFWTGQYANALETLILYQHLQGRAFKCSSLRGWSFKNLQIPKSFFIFHPTSDWKLKLRIIAPNLFAEECNVRCEWIIGWRQWQKAKAWLMIAEHWLTARMTIDKRTIGQWPILMHTWTKTKLLQMVGVSDICFYHL